MFILHRDAITYVGQCCAVYNHISVCMFKMNILIIWILSKCSHVLMNTHTYLYPFFPVTHQTSFWVENTFAFSIHFHEKILNYS